MIQIPTSGSSLTDFTSIMIISRKSSSHTLFNQGAVPSLVYLVPSQGNTFLQFAPILVECGEKFDRIGTVLLLKIEYSLCFSIVYVTGNMVSNDEAYVCQLTNDPLLFVVISEEDSWEFY